MSIEQIGNRDIPLRDGILSNMILSRSSFRMHDLDYSRVTAAETFHHVVSVDNGTTPSTSSVTDDCPDLNSGADVFFARRTLPSERDEQLLVSSNVC